MCAGLLMLWSGDQNPSRQKCFYVSAALVHVRQLSCAVYSDHAMLVGRSDGEGECWPPSLIYAEANQNEIANIHTHGCPLVIG